MLKIEFIALPHDLVRQQSLSGHREDIPLLPEPDVPIFKLIKKTATGLKKAS